MTGNDFKILQLTDLHYRAGYKIAKSDELIRRTVEIADPDMIVITGDLVMTVENNFYVEHVAELFADIGIGRSRSGIMTTKAGLINIIWAKFTKTPNTLYTKTVLSI